VVDFLQLPHYPIFNIADSAIVSAAALIAVMAFRGIGLDGTRLASRHTKSDNTGSNSSEGDNSGSDNSGSDGADV
jgi:signal peptidase II